MNNNKTPFKFLPKEFKKYLKTRRLQKQQKKASKEKKEAQAKKKSSSAEAASKSSAEGVPKQLRIEDEEAEEFVVIAGTLRAGKVMLTAQQFLPLNWGGGKMAPPKEDNKSRHQTVIISLAGRI